MKSKMCETCIHTNVCFHDKNTVGDVFVAGNPMIFDNRELYEKYKEREQAGFPCDDYQPEIVRCKDCKYHPDAVRRWDDDDATESFYFCGLLDGEDDGFCSNGRRS